MQFVWWNIAIAWAIIFAIFFVILKIKASKNPTISALTSSVMSIAACLVFLCTLHWICTHILVISIVAFSVAVLTVIFLRLKNQ